MIKVLATLPGDMAIVSTKGLQRIVGVPDGAVLGELEEPDMAEAYLQGYRAWAENPKSAHAVDYEASATPAASFGTPPVLAILPGCVVVASDDLFRVVDVKSGEIIEELADEATARKMVEYFGRPEWKMKCVAIKYSEMADAGDATSRPVAEAPAAL